MKRKGRTWTKETWIAETTAEPPNADGYVPEGMIRLTVRAYFDGDCGYSELLAPTGHPVYRTLIGVDCHTVTKDNGTKVIGTVHWATPEAVAQSAEIYAHKVARGEVPDPEVRSNDPDTSRETR